MFFIEPRTTEIYTSFPTLSLHNALTIYMLTAGDEAPVVRAVERMMAMRAWRRAINVDGVEDHAVLEQAGLTAAQAEEMYRYLAIANYEDRLDRKSTRLNSSH